MGPLLVDSPEMDPPVSDLPLQLLDADFLSALRPASTLTRSPTRSTPISLRCDMSSSRMTWPVMSFDSNTGARWPHLIEPRNVATSDGTHDSTGIDGVDGSPDERDENDEFDRAGALVYADAGCCLCG